MAKVLVVTSGKGGVGKTTTTAAMGAALAQAGEKVVVVDFDVGLRNLDLVMGAERRVVFDLINVVHGVAKLPQALIRDHRGVLAVPKRDARPPPLPWRCRRREIDAQLPGVHAANAARSAAGPAGSSDSVHSTNSYATPLTLDSGKLIRFCHGRMRESSNEERERPGHFSPQGIPVQNQTLRVDHRSHAWCPFLQGALAR